MALLHTRREADEETEVEGNNTPTEAVAPAPVEPATVSDSEEDGEGEGEGEEDDDDYEEDEELYNPFKEFDGSVEVRRCLLDFMRQRVEEYGIDVESINFLRAVLDFHDDSSPITTTRNCWKIISSFILAESQTSIPLPLDVRQALIRGYRRGTTSMTSSVPPTFFDVGVKVIEKNVCTCLNTTLDFSSAFLAFLHSFKVSLQAID